MTSRAAVAVIALLACCAPHARAQRGTDEFHPFATGALMAGALGFARPPVTNPFVGGYGYVPVHRFLIGAQGGGTVAHRRESNATYGLATFGYTQTITERWQTYPFVGLGAGTMRARQGRNTVGMLAGAGLGADLLLKPGDRGIVIGCRTGYIARSLNDDESVAYLAIAIGAGGRRTRPIAVARR